MTCGRSRSFDVAGSFSLFACMSSAAAASIVSRRRDTSSSAYLSSTSSSSLLFLFGLLLLAGFKAASICMSNIIFFAARPSALPASPIPTTHPTYQFPEDTGSSLPPAGPASSMPVSSCELVHPPPPLLYDPSRAASSLQHASSLPCILPQSLRTSRPLRETHGAGAALAVSVSDRTMHIRLFKRTIIVRGEVGVRVTEDGRCQIVVFRHVE